MRITLNNYKLQPFRTIVASLIILAFLPFQVLPFQAKAYAQTIMGLPVPGTMVALSPTLAPPVLKGIKLYPNDPLRFDFIIDTGSKPQQGEEFKEESTKLIKYFLASLTIPEKDLWVNLSPYEKDKMIPQNFGTTEMGRDLLAQDYMLKQITASLIYPEDDLGREFWDKVYEKAYQLFGNTNIPVNTFNKVWIIPDEALVYENGDTAFIIKSHLKVMLEGDYLALQKNLNNKEIGTDTMQAKDVQQVSDVSSSVVKDVVLPALEQEVNNGENFAALRQIYNSVIMATWFKKNLRESLLGQVYVEQNKTRGVNQDDPTVNEQIYQQYLQALKKGVYDYIKEDYDSHSAKSIPRKYFAGGAGLQASRVMVIESIPAGQISPAQYAEAVRRSTAGDLQTVLAFLRGTHEGRNVDYGRVIDQIVSETCKTMGVSADTYLNPDGSYDLLRLVRDWQEQGRGDIIPTQGGEGSRMYLSDGGILVIIDERLPPEGHVGRGIHYQVAVYAPDKSTADHELAELMNYYDEAVRKAGIDLSRIKGRNVFEKLINFANAIDKPGISDEELLLRQNMVIEVYDAGHLVGLRAQGREAEFVATPRLTTPIKNGQFDFRISSEGLPNYYGDANAVFQTVSGFFFDVNIIRLFNLEQLEHLKGELRIASQRLGSRNGLIDLTANLINLLIGIKKFDGSEGDVEEIGSLLDALTAMASDEHRPVVQVLAKGAQKIAHAFDAGKLGDVNQRPVYEGDIDQIINTIIAFFLNPRLISLLTPGHIDYMRGELGLAEKRLGRPVDQPSQRVLFVRQALDFIDAIRKNDQTLIHETISPLQETLRHPKFGDMGPTISDLVGEVARWARDGRSHISPEASADTRITALVQAILITLEDPSESSFAQLARHRRTLNEAENDLHRQSARAELGHAVLNLVEALRLNLEVKTSLANLEKVVQKGRVGGIAGIVAGVRMLAQLRTDEGLGPDEFENVLNDLAGLFTDADTAQNVSPFTRRLFAEAVRLATPADAVRGMGRTGFAQAAVNFLNAAAEGRRRDMDLTLQRLQRLQPAEDEILARVTQTAQQMITDWDAQQVQRTKHDISPLLEDILGIRKWFLIVSANTQIFNEQLAVLNNWTEGRTVSAGDIIRALIHFTQFRDGRVGPGDLEELLKAANRLERQLYLLVSAPHDEYGFTEKGYVMGIQRALKTMISQVEGDRSPFEERIQQGSVSVELADENSVEFAMAQEPLSGILRNKGADEETGGWTLVDLMPDEAKAFTLFDTFHKQPVTLTLSRNALGSLTFQVGQEKSIKLGRNSSIDYRSTQDACFIRIANEEGLVRITNLQPNGMLALRQTARPVAQPAPASQNVSLAELITSQAKLSKYLQALATDAGHDDYYNVIVRRTNEEGIRSRDNKRDLLRALIHFVQFRDGTVSSVSDVRNLLAEAKRLSASMRPIAYSPGTTLLGVARIRDLVVSLERLTAFFNDENNFTSLAERVVRDNPLSTVTIVDMAGLAVAEPQPQRELSFDEKLERDWGLLVAQPKHEEYVRTLADFLDGRYSPGHLIQALLHFTQFEDGTVYDHVSNDKQLAALFEKVEVVVRRLHGGVVGRDAHRIFPHQRQMIEALDALDHIRQYFDVGRDSYKHMKVLKDRVRDQPVAVRLPLRRQESRRQFGDINAAEAQINIADAADLETPQGLQAAVEALLEAANLLRTKGMNELDEGTQLPIADGIANAAGAVRVIDRVTAKLTEVPADIAMLRDALVKFPNDGLEQKKALGYREVGGIDLNPDLLKLVTEGKGLDIQMPDLPETETIEGLGIDGFVPVIINITPVTNLPLLLGISETKESKQKLSSRK